MRIRELSIPGSFEIIPQQHPDERGVFLEWYRFDRLRETVGHPLELRQANLSVSEPGVVRGIHFALVPPGQAKYVTVVRGSVTDYVVDLRVGSPTFGQWDSVVLDDVSRSAVYLAEGLGHAFRAGDAGATTCYLASEVYNPDRELTLDPFDAEIALDLASVDPVLVSPRDLAAPSLAALRDADLLPHWDVCVELLERSREAAP